MSSGRRVSEYSSSFLDLEDYPYLEIRVSQRDKLSLRRFKTTKHNWRQGASYQPAYSKKLQTVRVRSLEGYLAGKGPRKSLELSLN